MSLLSALDIMRLEVVTPTFVTLRCLQNLDGLLQLLEMGHWNAKIKSPSTQGHGEWSRPGVARCFLKRPQAMRPT